MDNKTGPLIRNRWGNGWTSVNKWGRQGSIGQMMNEHFHHDSGEKWMAHNRWNDNFGNNPQSTSHDGIKEISKLKSRAESAVQGLFQTIKTRIQAVKENRLGVTAEKHMQSLKPACKVPDVSISPQPVQSPTKRIPLDYSKVQHTIAIIDEERCIACGLCIDVCTEQAIALQDEATLVDAEKCIGCASCVDECPNGAISLLEPNPT